MRLQRRTVQISFHVVFIGIIEIALNCHFWEKEILFFRSVKKKSNHTKYSNDVIASYLFQGKKDNRYIYVEH